jgi:DNA-binding NtrC family response regulator
MVENETIEKDDLPEAFKPLSPKKESETEPNPNRFFAIEKLKNAQETFVREFIRYKLKEHENDISQTAKSIGVQKSFLKERI